jgi:hypothetical protein
MANTGISPQYWSPRTDTDTIEVFTGVHEREEIREARPALVSLAPSGGSGDKERPAGGGALSHIAALATLNQLLAHEMASS